MSGRRGCGLVRQQRLPQFRQRGNDCGLLRVDARAVLINAADVPAKGKPVPDTTVFAGRPLTANGSGPRGHRRRSTGVPRSRSALGKCGACALLHSRNASRSASWHSALSCRQPTEVARRVVVQVPEFSRNSLPGPVGANAADGAPRQGRHLPGALLGGAFRSGTAQGLRFRPRRGDGASPLRGVAGGQASDERHADQAPRRSWQTSRASTSASTSSTVL